LEFLKRQKDVKTGPTILTDIEALNVDIPENRVKFRNHYSGTIKKEGKKKVEEDKNRYMDVINGEVYEPETDRTDFSSELEGAITKE
jgi:hypothetical protein